MRIPFPSWIRFSLRLFIGIFLLTWLILYGGVSKIPSALTCLPLAYFIIALIVDVVGSILLPAFTTYYNMNAIGIHFSVLKLIKINLAMRFYVLTLPHAITIAIRWMRYREDNYKLGWQLGAAIAFERATLTFVTVSLAAIFLLLRYKYVPNSLHILFPISIFTSFSFFIILILFISRKAFTITRPALYFFIKLLPKYFAKKALKLMKAIKTYQNLEQQGVFPIFFFSIASSLMIIFSGYLICIGLGISINLVDLGWIRSLIYFVTMLPFSIGGIGIREAGFTTLFVMHGIDKPLAVAFPLLLLSIQVVIGLIGAMIELLNLFQNRFSIHK